MSLVALAAFTGAAQFGSSVLGGIGQIREAEEMRRKAARAARYARADASQDMQYASSQMDTEEQAARLDAAVTQRGHDLQERAMGEQAIEEHGMGMVAQAGRGVDGTGTMRSFQRQLNQSAHAFKGLGLERTAAFGRERRSMEMLSLGRDQMNEGFMRTGRDINQFEDDAEQQASQAQNAAYMGMAVGALQGAATAGFMIHKAGGFTKAAPGVDAAAKPFQQNVPGIMSGQPSPAGTPSFNHFPKADLNAGFWDSRTPTRPRQQVASNLRLMF